MLPSRKKIRTSAVKVIPITPPPDDVPMYAISPPDIEMTPPLDELAMQIRAIVLSKNIMRDYVHLERLSQVIRRYHKVINVIMDEYPQHSQVCEHYYYNFLGHFVMWYYGGQIEGPQDYCIGDAQPSAGCIHRILAAMQQYPCEAATKEKIDNLDIGLLKFTHRIMGKLINIISAKQTSLSIMELLMPILQIQQY